MTNSEFGDLPKDLQVAYLLGLAVQMFGESQVRQMYDAFKPLIDDVVGQGRRPRTAGEAEDPADNYWGGVWQIYDTDAPAAAERTEPPSTHS